MEAEQTVKDAQIARRACPICTAPFQPSTTDIKKEMCFDCNKAAERHREVERQEILANQRALREAAFPKAFGGPFGR